ncbi:MAG TPA: M20/M25/M40 family metallo-hydrolase [Bacteroidales bacterium]|mgnify:CR=1 FL=1|nr:M20/M25/M40 family metallo-hydrolase [Bacteroidales bacterium]HPS61733.1 M20/M25/M40 family metallo-hydrolase [Bacteroidales bacterium]
MMPVLRLFTNINRAVAIAAALLFSFPAYMTAQDQAARYSNRVISAELMRSTIAALSADSMLGRATPGQGLDKAAVFIAGRFRDEGLKKLNDSWFQELEQCYLDLGNDNFLVLVAGPKDTYFAAGIDYIPFYFSGTMPAEGQVVFAGYGITAPEYNYDDYHDLDVNGKLVVILRQEPGQTRPGKGPFLGAEMTGHSDLTVKLANAKAHGANGVIVISGPLQYASFQPYGSPWPALAGSAPQAQNLRITPCDEENKELPMVHAGEAVVRALFGNSDSLLNLQRRIESSMKPCSFPFPGKAMALHVGLVNKPLGGRNVVAFIEGSDSLLSKEAIVIGGHYDHIGYRTNAWPGSDSIFNGADDNASGTSGMLAVARAFASMPHPPKRSVIFIAFAGEERGMLGSQTWIDHPLWPLDKTVAMLNLDMISRNHPDSIYILGARQNPGLMKVIRKVNRETALSLGPGRSRKIPGGSDHISFFRRGIPAVFFFAGLHEDYHSAADEARRTDAVKAARVARLAFLTAWQIANEGGHYPIKRSGFRPE